MQVHILALGSGQEVIASDQDAAAPKATNAPRRWRVHLPNSYLGQILDQGTASAYAVHLAAWAHYRRKERPDFVLNRTAAAGKRTKGGIQLGRRAFTAGLAVLAAGPLKRRQGSRNLDGSKSWAHDTWLPPSTDGYVELAPELIIGQPSKLVALVAVVMLSPAPIDAMAAAERIGLTREATIRALVRQAVAGGYIAAAKVDRRLVVARTSGDLTALVPRTSRAKCAKSKCTPIEKLTTVDKTTASSTTQESLGGREQPSDCDDGGSWRTEVRRNGSENDGEALRRADLAGALARYLTATPGGLHGFHTLVAEHGELARETVFAILARMAVHGAEPGMITSWGYFRGPIADALELAKLERNGIRPGDVFGLRRGGLEPECEDDAIDDGYDVGDSPMPPDDEPVW